MSGNFVIALLEYLNTLSAVVGGGRGLIVKDLLVFSVAI